MATRLSRLVTSVGLATALLGAGVALASPPAAAVPAPARTVVAATTSTLSTSTLSTSTLSASLTASATAGAQAGVLFGGRSSTVASRVLPVLTTKPRVSTLSPGPKPVAPTVSPAVAYANEVLRLVNVQRAAYGLPALKADTCATSRAVAQTAVIARTGTLAHQDLGAVLSTCGARGAGENIAYGNVTAAGMMTMWMSSAGHRANILSPSFTHIGVGASTTATGRWYGTQVFLTR